MLGHGKCMTRYACSPYPQWRPWDTAVRKGTLKPPCSNVGTWQASKQECLSAVVLGLYTHEQADLVNGKYQQVYTHCGRARTQWVST